MRGFAPLQAGVLCAALLALTALPAAGEWLAFDATPVPSAPAIDVVTDTPERVEIDVALPGLEISSRTTPDGSDAQLTIPGQGHSAEIGAPALPLVRFIVEVPHGAELTAHASASQARTFALAELGYGAQLFPVQPSLAKDQPERYSLDDFRRDAAAYARTGLQPERLVRLEEMGTLREHRLVLVEVAPVAYDAARGEILCHGQVTVRIDLDGADITATRARLNRAASPAFERMLANTVANYASFLGGHRDLPTLPAGMLIIVADAFEAAIDPLAEWKTLKGYHVTVATTSETGSSTSAIKNYIENAYDTWSVPPTWVLLVGDTNTIPTWTGSGCGTETDLNYVALSGGDYLPELAIGRFPGRSTTDVAAMVTKTLEFEQMILIDNGAYMNRAGWIASSDMSALAERTHNHCIDNWFDPAGMESIKIYERLGGSTSDITTMVNRGAVITVYSGHGYDNGWACVPFDQGDVRNLTNEKKYPFVCSHACETGSFGQTECYAETWVIEPQHGAIAFWGASNSTYWDEDDILEKAIWESYWERSFYDLGSLCHEGLMQVYLAYGGGGLSRYYFETYNIMGDPSVDLWATPADPLAASYADALFLGTTTLDVAVTSDGAPLENALVCAHLLDQTFAAGYTDATGTVTLTLDPAPTLPGVMDLTVTAHDHELHRGTIDVLSASGPYLVYDSVGIDDNTSGESNGNADGGADAGERLELAITLENVGNEPATNATATLVIDDPYVSVLTGTQSFGSIPAGGTGTSLEDYVIQIAGTCPDGHLVSCQLEMAAEGREQWEAGFSLAVEAPALEIAQLLVDDTSGGDGNGRADPGETVALHFFVTNTGSEDATTVAADLSVATGMLEVLQTAASAVAIAPGATVELTPAYSLAVDAACPAPETFDLYIDLTGDWSYGAMLLGELAVGGFWDDIEGGEGGWSHYAESGGFVDQWHRSEQRNATPSGSWSWKQGDAGSGDYANLCDGCLVTETVSLADTTVLRFNHWMEAETSSAYPDYCYDGGRVEISVNGGAFAPIAPDGGYPYLIRAGGTPGPFPAETSVYSGSFGWTPAVFTLTDLSGTAQFRFRFGSDGAEAREGWYLDDVEVSGHGAGFSVIDGEGRTLALTPQLRQNRPNPFRPATMIAFELPQAQPVRLAIFDAGGRLVRTLLNEPRTAGLHRIDWDGDGAGGTALPSGVYYYRLETETGTLTRSMTLVR